MAPNDFGSPHQDSWCSESVSLAGPTSTELSLTLQRNPYGYTANMVTNSANQTIGVSLQYATGKFFVVMFDKECNIISATEAGERQGATFGGGYFYLDNHDNTVTVQNNKIVSYPTQEQPLKEKIYPLTPNWASQDIVELVTGNDNNTLYSALPVWTEGPNLYWCLIAGQYDYNNYPKAKLKSPAYMAVVEILPDGDGGCKTTLRGSLELENQWNNNTFAVDESGAYIVTNGLKDSGVAGPSFLWAFAYDEASGDVSVRWKTEYENAGYLKPGQKNIGSGTTPTLSKADDGTELVAITDNADPRLNVLVCRRDDGRPIAQVPCFEKMRSADDDFAAIETLYGIGYRYNEE